MKTPRPLDYKSLRKKLAPTQLNFVTTNDVSLIAEFIGQERAVSALNFGIDIKSQGYNLYAMGPPGVGKRSLVHMVLELYAKKRPVPPDWCYIYNFSQPESPIALQLPTGMGLTFQQDMKVLVEEVGSSILSVLESDEYRECMQKITDQFHRRRKKATHHSKKVDLTPKMYKEQHNKEKELQLSCISSVVTPLIDKLKKKYSKYSNVSEYLSAVEKDIIENFTEFVKQDEKTNIFSLALDNPNLIKYKVNLLVDNNTLSGAPIVFEEAPSYSTLICRVEHTTHLGVMVTNFTLIKPGSLHRANGGFLVVEARKLKKNPEAWEALKSALFADEIKIKPIDHEGDSVRPVSLEPSPIPLNVKVVLIGDRNTYYSFSQRDPDFPKLFKVAVDFDEQIDRDKKNVELYTRLIATIVRREKLKPFHASAVAAIIDYSTRLAEDNEKLSTHIRDIINVIIEADYWSSKKNKKIVYKTDVDQAIEAQIHRVDRSREIYYEDITRNFIIINTTGLAIGQVNCLSVRRVGNFSYGHPTRVTARARVGTGRIIDIQREVKMAGPMHSKAGLTLIEFLASKFNVAHPFSLVASLSFEQIYCWTDGDSASVGELCALLSALAEVPIRQNFAVTGSIDQYGEVQAIGGLNEKIEGFYDICKERGLTGQQGVLIPDVNKKNLMLREDIVNAARKNKFFIFPITTIEEAILLLTGMPAGVRDKEGEFPKNSLYRIIERKLQQFSRNKQKNFLKIKQ